MNPPLFVRRKSYGGDLVFEVLSIDRRGIAHLRGYTYRIFADAPVSDLIHEYPDSVGHSFPFLDSWYAGYQKKAEAVKDLRRYPIRVLHIDGDPEYLDMCLSCYQKMNVTAAGAVVEESRQPLEISALLHQHHPDILIITGHDALPKGKDPRILSNYRSSYYFAEAVRRAREYEADLDRLIIFAGACQSYYEELISAGANFASSPGRILIHAMDPVIICESIILAPFDTTLRIQDVIRNTYSGSQGIGGFDTRGKARYGQ